MVVFDIEPRNPCPAWAHRRGIRTAGQAGVSIRPATLDSGESIQFAYEKLHIIYPDITKTKTGLADILFDSEMELNLGGVTAHLIHVDTPHTRDAVLVYVPEDKVLIGGDAHDVDYYDNRGKFDADRLKQFVDFLQPLPFEHYLKGHDGASVEKGELLSALENGKTLPGSLMM